MIQRFISLKDKLIWPVDTVMISHRLKNCSEREILWQCFPTLFKTLERREPCEIHPPEWTYTTRGQPQCTRYKVTTIQAENYSEEGFRAPRKARNERIGNIRRLNIQKRETSSKFQLLSNI